MSSIYKRPPSPDEIYHHGILGQKWGVRRYQNADGTLTSAGKSRYASGGAINSAYKKINSGASKSVSKDAESLRKHGYTEEADAVQKVADKYQSKAEKGLSDKQVKAIKIGAAVTATALATAGTVYLVKSGKGDALVKAGKAVASSTINKGKNAVDKVISKTTHGKFMKMPEKEIDAYIERMGKVKKAMDYHDTVEHPLKGRTKKIVTKTAETAATGAAAYLVGSTVDKRLNKEQLGDYMRRGGAKKK